MANRYTASDERWSETPSSSQRKRPEHSGAGKIFSLTTTDSRSTKLTNGDRRSIYRQPRHPSIYEVPCYSMWVSPSPVSTPGLTKGKQTLSRLRAASSFRLTLQYFHFSPGFPESCMIPKLSRIPAFAVLSRTSKLPPETHARSQNEYSKTNPCPKPEPDAWILRVFPKQQTSALPEAIRTTGEVSREYGEHHHFQQNRHRQNLSWITTARERRYFFFRVGGGRFQR